MTRDKRALRRVLNPQLERGEWVRWVGQPAPLRLALREKDALGLGVLGLVMLGLVLLVYPSNYNLFGIVIFGYRVQWVVLVFAALALFGFSQPIYRFWVATQTIYAVTERRALSLKPTLKGPVIQSYTNIQHVERRDLADGKGDLIFGREKHVTYHMRYGRRVHMRDIGFFGIEKARDVEALIHTAPTGTEPADSL